MPLGRTSRTASERSERSVVSSAADAEEQPLVHLHRVIDDWRVSVSVLKFAKITSTLLAYGAVNGSLRLCSITDDDVKVLQEMQGHTSEVTDLDWSLGDHYLCSISLDKSIRLWDGSTGVCIRAIYTKQQHLCVRFHPLNNSLLVMSTAREELCIVNFSTGRETQRMAVECNVMAMDMDGTGLLFAGDALGTVHTYKVDAHTGVMTHCYRSSTGLVRSSASSSVQFLTFSIFAHGPVLLVSTHDGTLRYFSVALEVDGYLSLRCSLKLLPRARKISAAFCPGLSVKDSGVGEVVVSGSEEMNVLFYDLSRPRHPRLNKLTGHRAPVVHVGWSYGQDFLATSDCDGSLLLWKRSTSPSSLLVPSSSSSSLPSR